MCRMLGVMCNDEDLLPCAVHEVRDAVRVEEGDHDGIGVGYYRHDEPLLWKRPSAEKQAIDWTELLGEINSNVVLAHVRRATVGAWKDTNTHPFRFRKWLFAHVGHLPGVEKHRADILGRLPPFLARNITGETDSELAFHLFLDVLFKEGNLNDLELGGDRLAVLLKDTVAEIDTFGKDGEDKQELAILVTNGQVMAAACSNVTMHYSHREAILECPLHEDDERKYDHGRFRGVMLGAAMRDPGHQWREVTNGSLLSISKELELKVQQL